MAQVVLLPSAPNTGLESLGESLARVGSDYVQNDRANTRAALQRQQKLEDVASERDYETSTADRNRANKLTDEKSTREAAVKAELVRLGFLAADKIDAPITDPAVAAAATEFDKSALATRYAEAIKAGDLTYDDLGDEAKVTAGLAKYSARAATNTRFGEDQRAAAVTSQNSAATEYQTLLAKANSLDQELAKPAPEPTQQQIISAAQAVVKANGQPLSDKAIQEAIPEATDKLRQQNLIIWSQNKQQMLIQRQLLDNQLRDNAARQNTATNRFGVVGTPAPAAPPPAAPSGPPAPNLASAQASFAARLAAPAASAAPAAPVSGGSPYASLFAQDQQEKATALKTQNSTLADPYNEALDRKQQILDELNTVQAGLNPAAATPPVADVNPLGGMPMQNAALRLTPDQQQQRVTQLQQQLAAINQEVEAKRRTMLGLDGAPAFATTAPAISNSQGTVPISSDLPGQGNALPQWWNPPAASQ